MPKHIDEQEVEEKLEQITFRPTIESVQGDLQEFMNARRLNTDEAADSDWVLVDPDNSNTAEHVCESNLELSGDSELAHPVQTPGPANRLQEFKKSLKRRDPNCPCRWCSGAETHLSEAEMDADLESTEIHFDRTDDPWYDHIDAIFRRSDNSTEPRNSVDETSDESSDGSGDIPPQMSMGYIQYGTWSNWPGFLMPVDREQHDLDLDLIGAAENGDAVDVLQSADHDRDRSDVECEDDEIAFRR